MCGITGYYALTDNAKHNLAKVKQSTDKLYLRGPDNGDVYTNGKVALGHRRLSIIDTSEGASQPMSDHTGRYVIVFNGEIFNYQELSTKYLQQIWASNGGPRTTSDTEVLLYLLIEHGEKCLEWLSGFFAFALYDTQADTLLLARDRYGKKPLLYYRTDEQFAFSSEMKSLLEWGIPKKLNYSVLHQYLQLNYIPQPQSMIAGVTKLKAGHYIKINGTGIQEQNAYYQLIKHTSEYNKYTYDEAQKQLVQHMDTSVKERMISDVPLGAFLSGGIDSSVVVALASKYTSKLNTFSIGYKDNPFFDETKYAKLVAEKYNTNHTVFSLSNDDFLEHIYKVLDYLDEPFADSSAIPEYILCYHTRKHVTVALSGDGGDEVFAGYNKHGAEWKMRQKSLINSLVKAGHPIWSVLPKSRNSKLTNLFRQLNRFAEGARLSTKDRYWRWASLATTEQASSLLSNESHKHIDLGLIAQERDSILAQISEDDINDLLLADMNLVLGGDMLVKVDMMSMANSLEVRSPFLDYKLVDFAFSIPQEYKVDGSMKKRIVQDAFRHLLPEEIYNRPKHGFEIPLLDWFKNELWGLINDDLLEKSFVEQQGIFDVTAIEQLKKKLHSNNPEDSHATIWALIVFQYWWKKYFS
ncbi:MAG: asparagine synthase (glutamine-hydrolyzing) [Chitinophagales bacterium]|nr:asparagine synthase (glutamine-hydrolyzing) [Chitinophagaceae bacterium]MCB9065073.1 asparagine synthase (glutamine-hydrolyzing) [Chitinophagales bacterium]